MRTATKVVFNTGVLYAKILISLAISLISVPMVLHALGKSDYGLYSLVGGIVAMLAFLNTSMSVSTQRFMSVAMGEGNIEKINRIFSVNIWLHLLLGVFVVIVLELAGLFVLGKLNIEPDSISRAKILYQFLIVTSFANIVCVPFNGVINAREDMLVFSIIGIIDSLLILGVAILLSHISRDRLLFYGFGMMFVPLFTLLLTYLFVKKSYPEYQIDLKKHIDKKLFKETFSFAGWNLFGALALICRNQGSAIIINLFLGTVLNASYGIANQVNGALGQFSATFQKAINPQLMKSEGMNNRKRLNEISLISSKFGVLFLCMLAVPIIIEMPAILELWLKNDIPPYALQLSRLILLLSIVTQYSYGLMSAIQAVGKIRTYTIVMSLIILLNLPFSYLVLKNGYPIYYVTAIFVLLEICSFVVRLFMSRHLTGMRIKEFFSEVFYPTLIIIGISTGLSLIPHYFMEKGLVRVIVTTCVFEMPFILLWWLAMEKTYRDAFLSGIRGRFHLSN